MVAKTLRRLIEAAVASYQDTIDVLLAAMAGDDLRAHQIRRAERAAACLQEAAQEGARVAAELGRQADRAEAALERLAASLERLEAVEGEGRARR